jgi:hypothetical protein
MVVRVIVTLSASSGVRSALRAAIRTFPSASFISADASRAVMLLS